MSLFSRLLLRWFNRHDPAIYSTGIIQKYQGYDYALAVKASRRAKQRSETGRKFPAKHDQPTATVVAIRRKERA